jgi:hypothetical protein
MATIRLIIKSPIRFARGHRVPQLRKIFPDKTGHRLVEMLRRRVHRREVNCSRAIFRDAKWFMLA